MISRSLGLDSKGIIPLSQATIHFYMCCDRHLLFLFSCLHTMRRNSKRHKEWMSTKNVWNKREGKFRPKKSWNFQSFLKAAAFFFLGKNSGYWFFSPRALIALEIFSSHTENRDKSRRVNIFGEPQGSGKNALAKLFFLSREKNKTHTHEKEIRIEACINLCYVSSFWSYRTFFILSLFDIWRWHLFFNSLHFQIRRHFSFSSLSSLWFYTYKAAWRRNRDYFFAPSYVSMKEERLWNKSFTHNYTHVQKKKNDKILLTLKSHKMLLFSWRYDCQLPLKHFLAP